MDTLIFFVPETALYKGGSFEDIIYNDKCIRIIYIKPEQNPLEKLIFPIKIKKLTKNSCFFQNDYTCKLKHNKIYKSGHSLFFFHLPQILKICAPKTPIVVLTASTSHIYTLKPLIMSRKNISFYTYDTLTDEFSEKLLYEYGISGGCRNIIPTEDSALLVMPGGEDLLKEGADTIINLSKSKIPWHCITPENISFKPPPLFKKARHIFRRADALETALTFFGLDFSSCSPVSVKFNKQKEDKN